jgi:sortase (surface protein transpeptidase)
MRHASIVFLGIACVLCTSLFLAIFIFGLIIAPDSGIKAPAGIAPVAATSSDPVKIRIPRLSIDAPVEFVGLTLRGTMGAPSVYAHAGWYGYGTIPGQIGSAVIDGHVDDGFGLPGVFARLRDMRVGDDVFIETRKGDTLRFRVSGIEAFAHDAPTGLIFRRDDAARLNLITCDGRWDRADNTYAQRLVVFTELVR